MYLQNMECGVILEIMKASVFYLTSAMMLSFATAKDWSSTEGRIQDHAHSMAEACVSIKAANGAWGSGVIVSQSGLIFSAAHVYRQAGEMVNVFLAKGEHVSAKVIKMDRNRDVAVLKLIETIRVQPVMINLQGGIANGETLVAAGHASGYNAERKSPLRIGFGFAANERDMIYSTCRITAGDSGGPLYDEAGRLCGVHHTMDGKGKFSAHIPVKCFFELWPDLARMIRTA